MTEADVDIIISHRLAGIYQELKDIKERLEVLENPPS